MMDGIIEPTMDYDFTKLYFGPPTSLAGGAYFTRLMYNTNKLLFIQTPKSLTKQGFIKSGKKHYADLMFDNNDTVFINWVENLESRCQELIYAKRDTWFENKLEKDDIENAFTSPFKIFKSGKYYLLRVNVKQNVKIYDETDQIVSCDSITPEKTIISILEIQGLKFTSRNFQIEIELKQTMIVSPDPFLDSCFIKKPIQQQQIKEKNVDKIVDDNKPIDLDNLINNSVQDLAKKDANSSSELSEPIDKHLDTTIFGLEEADIDLDLDVEDLEPKEDPNGLKEFDLTSTLDNNLETIQLKKPNQVYYNIYKKAREKAKEAKKSAILAYNEMKHIKKTYMLDESDSDNDDFDNFSETSDPESLEENE